MFSTRRLSGPALLLLVAIFLPAVAGAVEEDPYLYRTLLGNIYFEYTNTTAEESGRKASSSKFSQVYSLDFQSNFLSRGLMVYDTGVRYSDALITTASSETDLTSLSYYLNTAWLPLSRIPLNLYARQTRSWSESSTSESSSVSTSYGLRWRLAFRTLPDTTIGADRSTSTGPKTDKTSTNYSLTSRKEYGPTRNFFSARHRVRENELNPSADSSQTTISFTNRTRLSKNTNINFGATRGATEGAEGEDAVVYGLNMGLNSQPSREFRQNHYYSYYRNEGQGTIEGQSYSGTLGLTPSSGLSVNAGLFVSNSLSRFETSTSSSEVLVVNAGASYMLTSNLSTSASFSHSKSTEDPPTTAFNLMGRETTTANASINYSKKLGWSNLAASYTGGYLKEEYEDGTGGEGIEQTVRLGLSRIDITRHAYFNASGSYSRTVSTQRRVDAGSSSFGLNATNRTWRRYVSLVASYSRSSSKSYITMLEKEQTTYTLNASSKYFRRTPLSMEVKRVAKFDHFLGDTVERSFNMHGSHSRRVFNGSLSVSAKYDIKTSDFPGGESSKATISYSAGYSRKIMDTMDWRVSLSRTETDTDGRHSRSTSLNNSLSYMLRSWMLSASHAYRIMESLDSDFAETILFLRASRSFMRIF